MRLKILKFIYKIGKNWRNGNLVKYTIGGGKGGAGEGIDPPPQKKLELHI
jgi:hypothetical protein